jgi:hypothetical protein
MNASWVQRRAEDLPADLGTFDVVTFAASFHWMDRPRVARTIRTMLEPIGAVVHVDNRHQDGVASAENLPAPPVERIAELRRAYRPHRTCLAADYRTSRPTSVKSSPTRRPTAHSRFVSPITSSRSGESRHHRSPAPRDSVQPNGRPATDLPSSLHGR